MDLLQKLNDLYADSRELEQNIREKLEKSPKVPEKIEPYVELLREYRFSANEHKDLGNYLLVMIIRELRKLNKQADRLRKDKLPPVAGVVSEVELQAVEHVKDLMIYHYDKIVSLLNRTGRSITLLEQAIEIQSKRMIEQAPA